LSKQVNLQQMVNHSSYTLIIITSIYSICCGCSVMPTKYKTMSHLYKSQAECKKYIEKIESGIVPRQYDLLIPHLLTDEWDNALKNNISPECLFFEKLHLPYNSLLNYRLYVEEKMHSILRLQFKKYKPSGRFLLGDQYSLIGNVYYLNGTKDTFEINILIMNKDFKIL
jgi:hypothetical protein